jgi:hypothetical protein
MAPYACIADVIMITTTTSPGQRMLTIAAEKAPTGALAVIVNRSEKSGRTQIDGGRKLAGWPSSANGTERWTPLNATSTR